MQPLASTSDLNRVPTRKLARVDPSLNPGTPGPLAHREKFEWARAKKSVQLRPLATTQLMMTWLSMCPPDESITRKQKWYYIACTSATLTISVISCVTSFAYCLKFISTDFDGAVFAFMVGIAEFGLIYIMIVAIHKRQMIDDTFMGLSKIYKTR